MAIFAEVICVTECVLKRHMHDIDTVLYLLLIYSNSYRFVELKSLVLLQNFRL